MNEVKDTDPAVYVTYAKVGFIQFFQALWKPNMGHSMEKWQINRPN